MTFHHIAENGARGMVAPAGVEKGDRAADSYVHRARSPKSICQVCRHEHRAQIEALLVGGAPAKKLAPRFGIAHDCLSRHARLHLSAQRRAALMVGPAKMAELSNLAAEESRSLLERSNIVLSVLFSRFLSAAEAGDDHAVANLAGRLNLALRDMATLTGELRATAANITVNNNTVNFLASPEFSALRSGLLGLWRKHPGVRADVVELLRSLDRKSIGPAKAPSPTIEAQVADAAA